jgi:hypothetical protein
MQNKCKNPHIGAQRRYHNLMPVLIPISGTVSFSKARELPARNIPVEFRSRFLIAKLDPAQFALWPLGNFH